MSWINICCTFLFKEINTFIYDIQGVNKKKLFELFSSEEDLKKVKKEITQNTVLINKIFGVLESGSLVVANGRVIFT